MRVGPALGVLLCYTPLLWAQPEGGSFWVPFRGQITIDTTVDQTRNYWGIQLWVVRPDSARWDTLAYAVTDSAGRFSVLIRAPQKGRYPLWIGRYNRVLVQDGLVLAPGDTIELRAVLPQYQSTRRLRSRENTAWVALENTRLQYNQLVLEALRDSAEKSEARLQGTVELYAGILWSIRQQYPGTMAALAATAEALRILAGWNDHRLRQWAETIPPEAPEYAFALEAAWGAELRLRGLEAARRYLEERLDRVSAIRDQANLHLLLVRALADSHRVEEARRLVRAFYNRYPQEEAALEWLKQLEYELDHLQPGQAAPPVEGVDREGRPVRWDELRGRYIVLEFWHTQALGYLNDLPWIDSLLQRYPERLRWISVGLDADSLDYAAVFEGRALRWSHLYEGQDGRGPLARAYNVRAPITRFLIDPQGRLLARFEGAGLEALRRRLEALLGGAVRAPK
ncbi:MAG: hypothetical protein RMK61_00730 [Bacteroidota bacterium]|nr:hypothetical protein [Bacteroidota bacterium]MDW8136959.1 hypothetical protein [Bacteroidota bacterium]